MTCIAELEQSDVYVGVIAFRLGSIEKDSSKSFTQLEYEHAVAHEKNILIYTADEENARFKVGDIDNDSANRARLAAFKERLREKHTVESYSTPEDLCEKIKRDFRRHFEFKEPARAESADTSELERTTIQIPNFILIPHKFNAIHCP